MSVQSEAFRGYARNAGKRWRFEDVRALKDLSARGAPLRLISLKLGRPDGAIRAKAAELNLAVRTGETVIAPPPQRTLKRPAPPAAARARQADLFEPA